MPLHNLRTDVLLFTICNTIGQQRNSSVPGSAMAHVNQEAVPTSSDLEAYFRYNYNMHVLGCKYTIGVWEEGKKLSLEVVLFSQRVH